MALCSMVVDVDAFSSECTQFVSVGSRRQAATAAARPSPSKLVRQHSSFRRGEEGIFTRSIGNTNDIGDNNLSLLQGKLSILQDVVKELNLRQKTADKREEHMELDHQRALNDLRQELETHQQKASSQESKLQEMQQAVILLNDEHTKELQRVTTTKTLDYEAQRKDLENKWLKRLEEQKRDFETQIAERTEQIQTKQDQIDALTLKLQTKLQQSQGIIETLKAQIASGLEESKQQAEAVQEQQVQSQQLQEKEEEISQLKGQLQTLQAKQERVVNEYKHRIQELTLERDALSSEMKSISQQNDEQIEIATAAVKAAEQRERRIQEELNSVQTQLQQGRVHLKVQKWVMDGIAKENEDLVAENLRLQEAMDAAQTKLATLEKGLVKGKKRGVGPRIRSFFSKKRT
jgi:chromosome segregation ATPase